MPTVLKQLAAAVWQRRQRERYAAAFDEAKHPRGQPENAGQFGSGGGTATAEVIGKGSTGDVTKRGEFVHKALHGEEGKVYRALRGANGVAAGEERNGEIVTPHFRYVISTDTIPEKTRHGMANLVKRNATRIAEAITALSESGYYYNDPIQIGLDADKKSYLFDFSNAEKMDPERAAFDNLPLLANFYNTFGLSRYGAAVSAISDIKPYADDEMLRDFVGGDDPDVAAGVAVGRGLSGPSKYAYFSLNKRPIQNVSQVWHEKAQVNIVLTNEPLTDDFMNGWELIPVLHRKPTPPSATAAKLSLIYSRLKEKYAAAFDEAKHPRGQPENAGQFGPGKGGAAREFPDFSRYEVAIVSSPREKGVLLSPAGEIIAQIDQQGEAIELNLDQSQEDAAKDSVFIHNHPGETAPSVGDFFQASRLNVKQMRVVVRSKGGLTTHTLERPEGGWPTWDSITKAIHGPDKEALEETNRRHGRGEFADKKAARIFLSNETARRLANKLGITYTVNEYSATAAKLSLIYSRMVERYRDSRQDKATVEEAVEFLRGIDDTAGMSERQIANLAAQLIGD